MNFKNNFELSIYLRSFGIFDINKISVFEKILIEFFKTENINKNVSLKQKFKTLYVLANNNFKKLKLTNIKSKCEDWFNGWKEESPFDKIFISFVVHQINDNLIKQINYYGKCISPKLSLFGIQILQLFKVDKNKSLSKIEDICEVNFDFYKTL